MLPGLAEPVAATAEDNGFGAAPPPWEARLSLGGAAGGGAEGAAGSIVGFSESAGAEAGAAG